MTRRTLFATGLGLAIVVCSPMLRAQSDMTAGTWELNVAKSTFAGAAPRSQTRTWETSGQMVKYTLKGVDSQGKPMLTQYTAAYDGKDYPITGAAGSDTIALTRVDARTVRFTQKLAGRVVATGTRVVAPDGRTVTVTSEGTNAAGQPTKAVLVFDRR